MHSDRKIFRILIAFLSLRRPIDFLIKPAFSLSLVSLYAVGVEVAVHGQILSSVQVTSTIAALSAAPFFAVVFYVVTQLDHAQESLSEMAMTDPLTGLPNRRAFMDRTQWLASCIDSRSKGVVLALDADHFKRINDTWGHKVGDMCLERIADRMRRELRATDIAGRLGGEEFAVFLPGGTLQDGLILGNRLCQPIVVHSQEPAVLLRFTMSVGVSEVTVTAPLGEAMHQADQALYLAKERGRARVERWVEPATTSDVAV